ncbi:TPA: Blp family class II bacteriocin, partial [Staphylococcus aureus]
RNKMKKLETKELVSINGGKKNTWQQNVSGAIGSTVAGAGLGGAICGPACAVVGAHYGPIIWAGVSGATGAF